MGLVFFNLLSMFLQLNVFSSSVSSKFFPRPLFFCLSYSEFISDFFISSTMCFLLLLHFLSSSFCFISLFQVFLLSLSFHISRAILGPKNSQNFISSSSFILSFLWASHIIVLYLDALFPSLFSLQSP